MAAIQYYDVILKPVITEKSMAGMGDKKYTFLVHPEANKTQIKEAVEKMFEGAKVAKVNTMNQVGKTKRRGMVYGKTAKTKKPPSSYPRNALTTDPIPHRWSSLSASEWTACSRDCRSHWYKSPPNCP